MQTKIYEYISEKGESKLNVKKQGIEGLEWLFSGVFRDTDYFLGPPLWYVKYDAIYRSIVDGERPPQSLRSLFAGVDAGMDWNETATTSIETGCQDSIITFLGDLGQDFRRTELGQQIWHGFGEGFYNPSIHDPMECSEFLGYLDLSDIAGVISKKYRNIQHFHYPIEAMIKTLMYQRLGGIRANTHLASRIRKREIALNLGFKQGHNGFVEYPSRRTLTHFLYERLDLSGLLEIEDHLLIKMNEECKNRGIKLGHRVAVDSTPLECYRTDPDATWNGHYEKWMYKVHQITCMDTGLSLGKLVTKGTEYDGDYLIPMIRRLKRIGIEIEEVYGDNHYGALRNWAVLSAKYGIKCVFKTASTDRYRDDGSEIYLRYIYNKLWEKDGYKKDADLDYIANFLIDNGSIEPVGAYYRNQWMWFKASFPDEAQRIYNQRTEVERYHSHLKNQRHIEESLNVKGLHKVKIYVTTFWIAQHALALTRLQQGVSEGLGHCNQRILT